MGIKLLFHNTDPVFVVFMSNFYRNENYQDLVTVTKKSMYFKH